MDDFGEVAAAKLAEIKRSWGREADPSQADALVEYCRLYERKAKADAQVHEHGALVTGPNGFPVENPWLSISMKCAAEMRKIAKEIAG